MNSKSLGQFSEYIKVRVTPRLDELIKSKSISERISESELIRKALFSYFEKDVSDTDLVYSSLNDNTKKIKYLENKTELLALIIWNLAKDMKAVLPSNTSKNPTAVDFEFNEFKEKCLYDFKHNHPSLLESMLMDLYEQQEQG